MMGMGGPMRGGYFEHRGGRGGMGGGGGQYRTTNYQRPPPGNVPYQTSRCKLLLLFREITLSLFITVKEEDKVAVKIRGLPYQVRYEEIADFFRDHRYIEKSSILN